MKRLTNILLMGISHLLVSFTSIVVVTRILGFNIPVAFLFAGIGTLIFHAVTKNKLPVVLGVSGLYIGNLLYTTQKFGLEYAMGGVVAAGIVYIVLGLVMLKFQTAILKILPEWLLSTTVLLIGLSLLPIGASMMQGGYLIGLSALIAVVLVDVFGGRKLSLFALPIGIFVGTLVAVLTGSIDYSAMDTAMEMKITYPKFNWQSVLIVGLTAFPVFLEMLGDTKNTSDVIGKNVFEEVGTGRIAIGNGLATTVGGAFGANAYTTYSENTAFVMLSKFYNPKAQLVTATLMICLSFLTPVSKIIMIIPSQALGGVVTYLFSMIAVNSIKQLFNSRVNLGENKKVFSIIATMLVIFSLTITIAGVSISSVAAATIVGILMNVLINRK